MLTYCFKTLAVSAFRKKTALVILLSVLPPTLITLALTASVTAVELLSEDLLRHLPGEALILSREPVGRNCSRVSYGLATLVRGNVSTTTPVLYALDIEELSEIIGADLVEEAEGCPVPKVLLPQGLSGLGVQLPAYLEVILGDVRLNVCAVQAKLKAVNAPMIIGWVAPHTESGFLCLTDSASIGRQVTESVVSDISQLASRYSLLVISAYVPVLYLTTLKVFDELRQEVYTLSSLGVSRRKLTSAFTSFCSTAVLVVSLYSLFLGYVVLLLGRVVLANLSAATFPAPVLGPQYLLLPVALSLLEAPLAYVVFRRGYYLVLGRP
ncbi:MAG: hypothetical protein QW780_05990 [Sulfolobales archaeon]